MDKSDHIKAAEVRVRREPRTLPIKRSVPGITQRSDELPASYAEVERLLAASQVVIITSSIRLRKAGLTLTRANRDNVESGKLLQKSNRVLDRNRS